MTGHSALCFGLFFLAFVSLAVSMIARRVSLSLFFAFVYSLFVAFILLAMGHLWLALFSLWQSSAVSYFALMNTSLLLGSHQTQKHERRITFSLIFFVLIVLSLAFSIGLLMPLLQHNVVLSPVSTDSALREILVGEYGIVMLLLALMTLVALMSVFVLVRRDDAIERS
jgi:hypothetical protein